MALLTWITIFPLITAIVALTGPLLKDLPLAVRLGITTALTVPLMTWVVMPRVTRLLHRWLYPEHSLRHRPGKPIPVIESPEREGLQPPDPRRWRALALLGTAFFMVILDGTIVVTALPVIGHELGLSTGGLQWVISAYLISFGGFLLLGGRSADLLGRRRVFMAGVGLFVAASLACGLAPGAEVLIAARVVQGVSAAIMAPTALSLLMTVFPEGPERNKALGIWGGIGGVGATAGLLIGGPESRSSPRVRRRRQTTSFPVMRKAFLRSARNAAGRQLPGHTSTPCSDPPERSSWEIRKPSWKRSCA